MPQLQRLSSRLRPMSVLLASLCGCWILCGCSSLSGSMDKINPFSHKPTIADAANPAVEVACIWQPGEGRNDKGIPCRGFNGQVLFFGRKQSEPVLVDGTVRFYLFAERGDPNDFSKPLHQYDFSSDAWNLHATQTALGPGYSVFIPYPDPDPHQVRCQLRLRFVPRLGPTIYSEAVTLTLEGPPRPGTDAVPASGGNFEIRHQRAPLSELVEQASGQSSAPASDKGARRLRTDTFTLDSGVQQAAYSRPAPIEQPPRRLPQPVVEPQPISTGSHPLDGFRSSQETGNSPAALQRMPRAHPMHDGVESADSPQPAPQRRFQLSRPAAAAASTNPRSMQVASLQRSRPAGLDAVGWDAMGRDAAAQPPSPREPNPFRTDVDVTPTHSGH